MVILNQLVSSVFQLIVFASIPLIVYLINKKKKKSFFKYIGLKSFKYKNFRKIILLFIVSYFVLFLGLIIMSLTGDSKETGTIASKIANGNYSLQVVIPLILLYGFIQTGLSEELLFRGFIAKRLITKLGFYKGNILQALIFGLAHVFTLNGASIYIRILHITLASIAGYIFCYVNEKESEGSIITSWMFHSIINIITVTTFIILN